LYINFVVICNIKAPISVESANVITMLVMSPNVSALMRGITIHTSLLSSFTLLPKYKNYLSFF